MNELSTPTGRAEPFLTDVKTLRERARQQIGDGAVTQSYGGDPKKTIEILQAVLATELVCVLRYTQHAIVATGLSSEAVKSEFAEHAREEQAHAMQVAERINQLGGAPDLDPDTLTGRSAAERPVSVSGLKSGAPPSWLMRSATCMACACSSAACSANSDLTPSLEMPVAAIACWV